MSFTTRFSVLEGIKENDDKAWERFFAVYSPLIRLHGKDCGLRNEHLDDLVQNVMLSLVGQIQSFHYDPNRGRFRDYLRHIIRARAYDMLRDIYKQECFQKMEKDESVLDDLFRSEWEEHIRRSSVEKLKEEVSAKHFQIFQLLDIQNRKVHDVAKFFKLSEATIYSIRNRTEEKLKQIAEKLDI